MMTTAAGSNAGGFFMPDSSMQGGTRYLSRVPVARG
jgi:hypothetical protein